MTRPLPQDTEELLQKLQSGNDSAREAAAEELGKLKIRNERIINALKRAAVSDKNKYVRGAAKEALYVLGYELSSQDLKIFSESADAKQEATQRGRQIEGGQIMTQQTKTITCPSCGNVNSFTANECIKCGLALGTIREAMVNSGVPGTTEHPPTPAKPKKPAPPLPELPWRPTTEKLGDFEDSWRFLVRGMGDRAEEIAARFFKQLDERGLEGLQLYVGRILIDVGGGRQDSREYYFAERDLGNSALATMTVRIAPTGTDLFVEWRHYTTPPLGAFDTGIFWGIFVLAIIVGVILLVSTGTLYERSGITVCFFSLLIGAIVAAAAAAGKARKGALEGFQGQESEAFQLTVRAALEEAIDLAGISKNLIQKLPKEDREERRLI